MSTQFRAFRPLQATQNTPVVTTATTITLVGVVGSMSVRMCNVGTQTIFFIPREAGNTTDATFGNAIPLPAGQTEVFSLSQGVLTLSVIAAATGSTLYTTLGEGL